MESLFDKWLEDSPRIRNLPPEIIEEIREFAETQVARIQELVKIGMALSGEKKLDRLLEMIISEARRFTNADGGTLYIKSEAEEILEFMIIQNDSLNVKMGGSGQDISWPSVPLFTTAGVENHRNVSAHCALTGKPIKISDVYNTQGYDFQGTKEFDATTGYRSKSMLLVPMRDHEDEVIGVLQLLNAMDRKTGDIVDFPDRDIEDTISLASQAAIAVTNVRLIRGLENLLDAFLQSIAAAIDEKSSYTAGHVRRVAELTECIAREVSRMDFGSFKDFTLTDEELAEIRMAAWMHDVGKITTPEYVVDKATKLQTVHDRIEIIRCRFEILKRDAEIRRLKKLLDRNEVDDEPVNGPAVELDEAMRFIEQINIGGEFLGDEKIEQLKKYADVQVQVDGATRAIISQDELMNLAIRRGTLTTDEREIINNHVTMTIRMLENLPFPRKFKNVPSFAGKHHEKLDGSGYPRGLNGEEIPLPARMLAVADIFEALTAADRPYKSGKLLSESMAILESMAGNGYLDQELCDLIVESGLVQEYSCRVLSERQRDDFYWKGRKYKVNCPGEKKKRSQSEEK